ncbi:MAG: hypothetical protein LKM32_07305 [Chiayiivirga sp.]|uniref:hypothetical protein n=1 Tax=Chiayiivirga sp. TaxID=2041042 RepID=UPI0025B871AD|nr:hypothetical protein [Chiayiivirga sp.]MCI1709203.1 hypothetical protein [Chiayiivirga sp.]MCI1729178.1 hypothetical protein [Chiayiivirga sp.]
MLGAISALAVGLAMLGDAAAITRYVVKTGTDGGACSSGSPCATITYALTQANATGDDIQFLDITPQVYAENLVLTKSVTITGNGSNPNVGNRTTIRSVNGGADRDVITVRAPNVIIESLIVFVDFANTRQGIRAESQASPAFSANNLIVRNTLVRVEATAPPQPAYAERNAIMVNPTVGPHFGVTVQNVRIDGTPIPSPGVFFRAGVDARNAAVTVTGSDIGTINHDLKLDGVSGTSLVDNNTFRFGGVQVGSYNNSSGGTTTVTVSNNDFFPGQAPAFPGLRLINNTQVGAGPNGYVATTVSGNQFGGTNPGAPIPELGLNIGVFAQNYPAVTISGNTFNPLTSASEFSHIIVSNKTVFTNDPPDAPITLENISITGNTFNGNAVSTDGYGIEFLNHNSVGATFGTITVGGSTTAANTFDNDLDRYISLSDESGPTLTNPYYYSAPAIIPATTMAPFPGSILAPNNLFDLGGGPIASSTMTVAQLVSVNQQTQDRRDHVALSLANTAIGVIVFGDENAAYTLDDPRGPPAPEFFLPTAPNATFEACGGTENFAGCFELSLTNTLGTAVPEHASIEFVITRGTGAEAIAAGNAALEYQATTATGGTPGNFDAITLNLVGQTLVGRMPVPATAITAAPIAIESGAINLVDGARVRFLRGG